ncbi:MAG TPA: glycosyltransferase, partial [Hyphomicrobiales bacterium]|nr:glycosyltransferase [Hyphomicrobiales bacterium]
MSPPRLFYLVTADSRHPMPDETPLAFLHRRLLRRRKRVPTGGVKVIYQHCDLLAAAGIEAFPVHLGDFSVDWMAHRCRALTAAEARVMARPQDILVVPERVPAAGAGFACRRRVAFVQNGGLVDKALDGRDYAEFGFTDVLCCSHWLGEFMASRTRLPVHVAVNGIDLAKFRPAPGQRRAGRILYLKRKATWEYGRRAIALLPADLGAAIEVVELENRMDEAAMVAAYRSADVFLALGFPEGFALPPLEAMACGAAVVGFTGGGGREHMVDDGRLLQHHRSE